MIIDVLGWIAMAIIISATWPQIIKNLKRKSTEGLSPLFILSLFIAMVLFLIVSLFRPTPLSLIVNSGVSMIGYGVVLFQMAMYQKRAGGS
ncbi:MAG: PQ-loop repeat-containing protein [Candidatus Spechtbacteria bacterium]|nr:PQ-loop repeat-containing protein [Candidatus Spechtbacteria bacterium]